MLKTRRLFGAASLLPLAFAAWPAAAVAQQPVQDSNTVGSPQLRDFTLPGTRTAPPAQVTPPPAAGPAPRAAAPATTSAPTRRAPGAGSRPARPAARQETAPVRPAPAAPLRSQRPAAPAAAPAVTAPEPSPALSPPPAATTAQPVPQPQRVPPPPITPPPPPQTRPPVDTGGSEAWLWLVGVLALLGGGAFLLLRRRRGAVEADARDRGALAGSLATAQWLPPEEEAPQPVAAELPPVPAPAAEPVVATAPAAAEPAKRAVLEVDMRPERASVMEDGALAHYSLILTNTGEAAAGNIRIDGRMFNAGADGEVDAFFAGPIHEVSGSPHVFLQPGESLALQGQIGMKREELYAIEVQGRLIFVPLVAMNVAYEWEGGGGRTSTSWLVGRTPSSPEARMGAFRLDLGPRIYRQVDRREAKKALV